MAAGAPDPLAVFARRLAACVRMVMSDKGGEVANALEIIQRLLRTEGIDLHAIAERIETPAGMNEATKEKIRKALKDERAAGYAEGVRAAEAKQHGADEFRNADGTPDWRAVALFVQREKHRLPVRNHEFIDKMASKTVYGHEPSEPQHKYLKSLFYQLGGKIT
jgi:hypothetical protein